MYDLIIIGGGPAGLAAGVYAARKRLNTLMLSYDIGGQVNWTTHIENYLGYQFIEGRELIDKFHAQVEKYPIEQKIGTMVSRLGKIDGGFEVNTQGGDVFQSRAIVLATGKRARRLNVSGETKYSGKGVTFCAICDGPLFAGQKVAVIGGGNSGLEAALDMSRIAEHVALVSLELTGDQVLIDKIKSTSNLTVYTNHQVEKIDGTDFVESITIKDKSGGEPKTLEVGGVLVEIGMVPNSNLVKGLTQLNEKGEIPINCSGETDVAGLFAAGDVTSAPEKQIIVAAGDGAKAALQAHRYLQFLPQVTRTQ